MTGERVLNDREKQELSYWQRKGISLGRHYFVQKHKERLEIFRKLHSFPSGLIAIDIGCGPFGGMSLVYKGERESPRL